MSTFNAKRLTGLFLLILVSVLFLMNSMKESEKQKLGRLVESRCAMDGLSKNGCKIKLLLAELRVKKELINRYSFGNSSESAQLKMELAAIEKQEEALNSLGEESNDLLTESDVQLLFARPVHPSTGGVEALMGTISMITRDELVAMNAAIEEKRIQLIQLNNIGT
jgi:hypothetical protein